MTDLEVSGGVSEAQKGRQGNGKGRLEEKKRHGASAA